MSFSNVWNDTIVGCAVHGEKDQVAADAAVKDAAVKDVVVQVEADRDADHHQKDPTGLHQNVRPSRFICIDIYSYNGLPRPLSPVKFFCMPAPDSYFLAQSNMKAAFIRETGSPDVIQFEDLPDPTIGDDDVLIQNKAVSVNPIDTYIRSGMIALELPNPYIIGCDAAGIVEAVGSSVKNVAPGDRVWCTNQGLLGRQGTFAEKIAVDSKWCYKLPESVAFADAAACALVGITAHLGLFRNAKLTEGETVLVIGGSGGVGSMVVQMAKAVGARVIATGGNDEKCERIKSLGADVVINYAEQSIVDEVKSAAPGGVNVFWETRREPDFFSAVDLLSERGRMILMAGRDAQPEFPVGPFYVKQCSLTGFVMFKGAPDELSAAADDINDWLVSGKLRANVAATFDLSESSKAHALQQNATVEGTTDLAGKIVLTIQ